MVGVGVKVGLGVMLGVDVDVAVGVEVGIGVLVGNGVTVGDGVMVGPNKFPGPHPDVAKAMINTPKSGKIVRFEFIHLLRFHGRTRRPIKWAA